MTVEREANPSARSAVTVERESARSSVTLNTHSMQSLPQLGREILCTIVSESPTPAEESSTDRLKVPQRVLSVGDGGLCVYAFLV